MKQTLKKALSLLMTMAILCSFAVIPASAAGTVTIGLENGSWDGDKYTVDVVASGDFSVASAEVGVRFDPEQMSFVANASGIYPGYSANVMASVQGGNTVHVAGMSSADVPSSGGKLTLVTLTFQMVAGTETPTTSLQVVVDDALFEDLASNSPTLSADSALSVTLPVQTPAVKTVTLGKTAANVDGTAGDSTTVKAESAKGTDITSAVTWTVSPSGEGVTVSGGTVTVDAKAKAGKYVITAASGGETATAELTVTRAAEVAASVVIDEGPSSIKLPTEGTTTETYTATVKNQYGEAMTGQTITWSVSGETTGVSVADGTVTVTTDAKEGQKFTLTAVAGSLTPAEKNITIVVGIVNAVAQKWTGDDGSRIYIAIEDIDHANNIRDLYLDDLLPSRVSVTYPGGEEDYSSQYRVKWSGTRLWELFKELRSDWSKMSGNKGYYVVPNLGYYIESDGTEDTPVVIDYSGWFSLIIDEGSAEANGWYEEENTYVPPVASANFTDVAAGYWAADDINWCYAKKVMLGNSETTFNPTGVTSRQQLWMVLARVNGSAPDSMATARTWAINMGVSDGTNVSGSLTRQQMVAMLYRYSAIKGYSGKIGGSLSAFSDAGSVSSYARDAMSWAVANGIITGNDGRLNPNGTATRAQFAAIMHRFCDTFKVI